MTTGQTAPAARRSAWSRGAALQHALEGVEIGLGKYPGGSLLLGTGMAIAILVGGSLAFILVWALLVGVLH